MRSSSVFAPTAGGRESRAGGGGTSSRRPLPFYVDDAEESHDSRGQLLRSAEAQRYTPVSTFATDANTPTEQVRRHQKQFGAVGASKAFGQDFTNTQHRGEKPYKAGHSTGVVGRSTAGVNIKQVPPSSAAHCHHHKPPQPPSPVEFDMGLSTVIIQEQEDSSATTMPTQTRVSSQRANRDCGDEDTGSCSDDELDLLDLTEEEQFAVEEFNKEQAKYRRMLKQQRRLDRDEDPQAGEDVGASWVNTTDPKPEHFDEDVKAAAEVLFLEAEQRVHATIEEVGLEAMSACLLMEDPFLAVEE